MRDAIVVQGVGKQFYHYHPQRPNTIVEMMVRGLRLLKPADRFWALRNITFTVAPGNMVGVIGRNGAGKSTLLRLIGGVGRPDKGSIQVNGRIGALLELGAGFQPDLTGRENIFISGVISGLTRREVVQRFDAMVEFAELEAFIDNPLRTYSTGMQMRLAFAVASHIDPDILLIDEVLAVGDIAFQRKCLERIADFKANGCTIVLVSHEAKLVKELCDEVIWLRAGEVVAQGEAEVVVGQYTAEMTAETQRRTPAVQPVIHTSTGTELRINENRFGSLEMEITSVGLLNGHGLPVAELESGAGLAIEIEYRAPEPIPAPIFSVTISCEDGFVCYDTSTEAAGVKLPTLNGRGKIVLHLQRLDLGNGKYYIDVGVYEQNWTYAYDYHWHAYPLTVYSSNLEKGILRPPAQWQIDDKPAYTGVVMQNSSRSR